MADPVLELREVCKSFGALKASDHVSLDLRAGEIHALIGPNGAGKSTLIAQIAGSLAPDSGSIHFDGQDVTHLGPSARARLGLARSFQISAVVPGFTVAQNILLAVQARAGRSYTMWRKADDMASDQVARWADMVGCPTGWAPPPPISHMGSVGALKSRWRWRCGPRPSFWTNRWPEWGRRVSAP